MPSWMHLPTPDKSPPPPAPSPPPPPAPLADPDTPLNLSKPKGLPLGLQGLGEQQPVAATTPKLLPPSLLMPRAFLPYAGLPPPLGPLPPGSGKLLIDQSCYIINTIIVLKIWQ